MLITDMFVAFALALLLLGIFVGVTRATNPGATVVGVGGMLVFFAIAFLACWAGGVWVRGMAPAGWGGRWVGFLVVASLIVIVFSAALIRERSRRRRGLGVPPQDTRAGTREGSG
jgi:hypothetical protein